MDEQLINVVVCYIFFFRILSSIFLFLMIDMPLPAL